MREFKEVLDYNKDTGIFTWRVDVGGKSKVGSPAGNLNTDGYVRICFKGKRVPAHRLAWYFVYGYIPTMLDHKDRNRTNNRINNLRLTTTKLNGQNRSLAKNNASGVTGVRFKPYKSKTGNGQFAAYIKIDNVLHELGYFVDFFEAVCARKSAERFYGFAALKS